MGLMTSFTKFFVGKGSISDFGDRYPDLDANNMSSIEGLYIVGNVAGTPDIRAALNAGHDLGQRLATGTGLAKIESEVDYDVLIVGGGPAALACAAALRDSGRSFLIVERRKILATIRAFKADLWLYDASTGDLGNRSALPYSEKTSSDLLAEWEPLIASWQLPIEEGTGVESVTKLNDIFNVKIKGRGLTRAATVVLATGKLIQLDKLGVRQQKIDCREVEHSIDKYDEPDTRMVCQVVAKAGMRFERDLDTKGIIRLSAWVIGILLMYLWLYYYDQYDSQGRKLIPGLGVGIDGWFAYSTIYTAVIWIFGIKAILRWKDPLQTKKYSLLIVCQTLLFWGLPIFFFQKLQDFSTPKNGFELGYIWPLAVQPENIREWLNGGGWAFYMFLWNMVLSFLIIPIVAIKHGKKYCSWVCGCGGLAETLGDSWRHFSPKGKQNKAREKQGYWITGFAIIATAIVILNMAFPNQKVVGTSAGVLTNLYKSVVDVWLIGIIPVVLYPFMGGKIWCRFWCPSAVYMQLVSKFWAGVKKAKGMVGGYFAIHSKKERCIACNMCTRYCEVGIDVRSFAIKGKSFDNANSSCIGCGICITVCPTDVLSFDVVAEVAKQEEAATVE